MEAILALVVGGLVIGALARLALPGPDPIPIWATILLGIGGTLVGGGVGFQAGGPVGAVFGSVVVATLILYAFRRFVQKRPITGPDARRRPGAGEREPADPPEARLRRLEELRDQGVIGEDEFELKRRQLQRGA